MSYFTYPQSKHPETEFRGKTRLKPRRIAFLLSFLCILCVSRVSAQTTPVNFTFNLSVSAKTSAGVFKPDGTLIRTLWSGVDYASGAYTKTWDKKDDNGNLMSGLNFVIKVVSNNVTYSWDGVVGNTSTDKTGGKKIRHLRFMWDVCFAGTKGYYCTEFVEGNSSANKFQLANIQSKDEITPAVNSDVNLAIKCNATDGNYVYWAGYDAYGSQSFTYATKVSDESEVMFSSGSSVSTQWGRIYPKAIDILTGENPSGIAVQKTGNYLFIAHETLDLIKVFNKTSGALVSTHSISKPRDMATDANNDLWVISATNTIERYTVNSTSGALSSASTLTGPGNPISLSCYGSYIAIADESTSQVKCYDISNNSSVWTLGQKDGYATDATVENDKFYFHNNNNNEVNGFVSFGLDGSIWVGDPGNNRLMHFSSARAYIESIMFIPMSYNASVNTSDPTRVFSDWLEFKVDYSKTLGGSNGSWQLVKNWGHGLGTEYLRPNSNTREIFKNCVTLSNGRTYATIEYTDDQTSYRYPDVVELVEGGKLRVTGIRLNAFSNNNIDPVDGTLTYVTNGKWYERKLTGFSNDNPVWGTASVISTAPGDADAPRTNTLHNPVITSTGMLVAFDRSYTHTGFHLAAIKKGTNAFAWKTSPSTTRNYTGPFPGDGSYDIGNGVEYAGGQVYASERSIFWNYVGEFWKNSQTNKWNHYYDNGLFINQFGITTIDAEKLDGINSPRMAAGNAFAGGLVKVGSDYYIYHCDESVHGGTHRWKVSGLNTIKEEVINLNSSYAEINVTGNSVNIVDGSNAPSTADNTDYGSVNTGSSANLTYVINNTGTSDLTVSNISFSGTNSGDFTLVSAPSYPLTITASGTYTITVKFAPSAGGSRNAVLNIVNTDADEDNYDFAIKGNGVAASAPAIQIKGNGLNINDGDASPGAADNTHFGTINSGTTTTKSFVIENNGTASLSITACNFTGTQAAEFSVVNPPSYPLSIAASGTYTLTVQFAPQAAGTRNAMINIQNNDASKTTYNFSLRGVATTASTPVINIKGNGVSITDGDASPGTSDNTHFGSVLNGSSTSRDFIVQNTGSASLSVSNCDFSGTNAADFTIVNPPAYPLLIAAGNSFTFTVKFEPLATGTRTASMNVYSNDPITGTYNFTVEGNAQASSAPVINVQGNGLNIGNGDNTPDVSDNTDFGTVLTGASTVKSFVIQNMGTAPLHISSCTFTGLNSTEFSVVYAPSYPLTIAPNSTYAMMVKYTPSAIGTSSANMQISNDDAGSAEYTFALQGQGTEGNGIEETKKHTLLLYPNPSTGLFSLKYNPALTGTVEVYNIMGQKVYEDRLSDKMIDLTGHAEGIYTVYVLTAGESFSEKLILRH